MGVTQKTHNQCWRLMSPPARDILGTDAGVRGGRSSPTIPGKLWKGWDMTVDLVTQDLRFFSPYDLPVQVQCHTYTGYCWCVTPDGKPISGSSVQNKTPVCSGTVKRGGKKGQGWRETTWLSPAFCRGIFERRLMVMSHPPGQGGFHANTLAL